MHTNSLIIQGNMPDQQLQEQLGDILSSGSLVTLAHNIWQLTEWPMEDYIALSAWCANNQLDCASVPLHRQPGDYGLLAMDMDSTLIAVECIDEIADMLNLKPQVAAITESTMRGEMPFSESLTRRVALLAGLQASELERVYQQRVTLNPGAERLINRLKQLGIKTLLVSGGFTFFTHRLRDRLGIDVAAANELEIVDGRLTGRVLGDILDGQAKADWLKRVASEFGVPLKATIAVGDGANDIPMLTTTGLSFAYHAKPIVRDTATHTINFNGLDAILPLLGDGLEKIHANNHA